MAGVQAPPLAQRQSKSRDKKKEAEKKEAEKTNDGELDKKKEAEKKEAKKTNDGELVAEVAAIDDATIKRVVEAIDKAVDKNKSNPPGSKDTRRKSEKSTKSKTGSRDKTSLKPLTVKVVPKGCHDSLKMVEERVVLDTIKDSSKAAEEVIEDRTEEDMYIVTLLKGLNTITDIAVAPLEEILCDAKRDPDKKAYLEKTENCYKNASLLNKLGTFMDVIQAKTGKTHEIECLPSKITKMLVDINPTIAEKLYEDDAIEKEWGKLSDLKVYIKEGIKPIIKIAIKNLLMTNFKYRSSKDAPLLEPTTASNDFRVTRTEERLAVLEAQKSKIEVIADTLAREIGDLRQAKASADFEREEPKLKLMPNNKDGWAKMTEDQRKEKILAIVVEMIGAEMAARTQIFIIKARDKSASWVKLTLPSADQKYKLESLIATKRKSLSDKDRKEYYSTGRLTPMDFRREEKDLKEACKYKLTEDWIMTVRKQGKIGYYITDPGHLMRFWQLRIKWRVNPKFSCWMEMQDPIHRHSWTPVNLEGQNHFQEYDFGLAVPCPVTRQKAEENPEYLVPRQLGPRDFSIILTKAKGPERRLNSSLPTAEGDQDSTKEDTDSARAKKKEASKAKKQEVAKDLEARIAKLENDRRIVARLGGRTDRTEDDETALEAIQERIRGNEAIIREAAEKREEHLEKVRKKTLKPVLDELPGITKLSLTSVTTDPAKSVPKDDLKSNKETDSIKSIKIIPESRTEHKKDDKTSKNTSSNDSIPDSVDVLKDEHEEPKEEEEDDDEVDGSGNEEGGSPRKKSEDGTEDESDVEEPTEPTDDNPQEDEAIKSNTSSKSSSHRSAYTPQAEDDGVFQDANDEYEEDRSSQSIKNRGSPFKSPSVDALKKKFEDEGTGQYANIFNTPKSGVAKEKPIRVLVSPSSTTLVYKNSTQQSIVTPADKKKTKPKAKTSQMPTYRKTRANLLGPPPVRNSLSPNMD